MTFVNDSAALFSIMARTNHSCTPNAEFFARPKQYVQDLVATQFISKGEEITITYLHADTENSEIKSIRQRYLKRWYGFICDCRTCSLEGDLLQSDDSLRNSIKILQTQDLNSLTLMELDELVDRLRRSSSKLSYRKQVLEVAFLKAMHGSDLILSAKFYVECLLIDSIINIDNSNESENSNIYINNLILQNITFRHSTFVFLWNQLEDTRK